MSNRTIYLLGAAAIASLIYILILVTGALGNEERPGELVVIPATTTIQYATSTPSEATTTPEEKPGPTSPPPPVRPDPPTGAVWFAQGGLSRTACESIVDTAMQEKCRQEVAVANYIYTIVPNAMITKGFCFPGTAFDNPKNWNQCTDLSDFQTKTVHALQGIFNTILSHCATYGIGDCRIIITGGSELGHAGEVPQADGSIACVDQDSHCGGKKIDLRLTKGLESLVSTNFEKIENRDFDNAPQWRDPVSGNIYAREVDHWDILVP